ncbi:ARL14 effector protein isoform X2 [Takifugu rubripes]|nr:ARL14 effector protein isoform X2 [Takifugu rubripes]XP_029702000.1 ARL14 effector protein isoform X2 [Takifugu rubripes]XP_056881540.1 ARL14 effector protein isoform X2 [Takifugu flavidus]XP_056881542.1 ARL14 effector protein isoform X2 [Takifugu flavidus]XP_056881543.1 ARL14 effector protein isoform X2 [Takifugu flavidus]|eukprot:XP_011608221.1 PREDICTED: ARL14 effector protein isoform X2 [Takifugu rubripes]
MKNFVPTANTCLCSEHFRPECFRDYNGKQFLREDAVPTIPSHETTKIALRKRVVVPKETNLVNKTVTQGEQDRSKEAGVVRRDKRITIRGGRGGRGGKQFSDRQIRVYDNKGRLLSNSKDLCDCLDGDCMGCFYPCPECGSRKCGVECRCDRKWLYEQVEVEGGEIIRNKYAV